VSVSLSLCVCVCVWVCVCVCVCVLCVCVLVFVFAFVFARWGPSLARSGDVLSSVTALAATDAASPPRQCGGTPGTTGDNPSPSPAELRLGWVVPCVSSAASMALLCRHPGGGLVRGWVLGALAEWGSADLLVFASQGRTSGWFLPPRPSAGTQALCA
jgi:hypothetical protein